MTDWERVEKLRSQGYEWSEVADDRRVGFRGASGSDPGRELKTLYFRRRSNHQGQGHRGERGLRGSARPVPGRLPYRRLMLVGVGVAAIVLIAYALTVQSANSGQPTGWIGRQAPDFSLPIANGGGTFSLANERGHQNVLLFFNEGLSCSPCLTQMQQVDSAYTTWQSLNVVAVSITGDSLSSMTQWAQNSNVVHTDVCADPSLTVSNEYDTTGASVSMMPGEAPGHTFILVNENGTVVWRADYGPSDMSVPMSEIIQNVESALRT